MYLLSAYLLTKNSEKYLSAILDKVRDIAEDILIVDSGSTDRTEEIARSYSNVRWKTHPFNHFKEQRYFAEQQCLQDWILFLDSDELPDDTFIDAIKRLKSKGFGFAAYSVQRNWNVLGKNIHCLYPVVSPDFPIRLYNRKLASFKDSPQLVHEEPVGFDTSGRIEGSLQHITFETKVQLTNKLEFYTAIAAKDLINKRKSLSWAKLIFSPFSAFIKWYGLKDGYKDGLVGWQLGKYAFNYTLKKYQKAKKLRKGLKSPYWS